jgi:anti-sigma regulatory factor (Ser/Thr protein kinase)
MQNRVRCRRLGRCDPGEQFRVTKRWGLKKQDYRAACARRREFRALLAERYGRRDFAVHELVFGELVANAVRHGEDPIAAAVTLNEDETVEINVENAGTCPAGHCRRPDLPRAGRPALTATGGRGLEIVRAVADTLKIEHLPSHASRVTVTLKV